MVTPDEMHAMIVELQRRISVLESGASDKILILRKLSDDTIHPDKLYTAAEAALWLSCSKANAYNLMMSGDLARTRVGAGAAGFRIRGSDIVAFLDSRREGGPKSAGTFKYLRR